MHKIGETLSGNILVEMSMDEWDILMTYDRNNGIPIQVDNSWPYTEEKWRKTEACKFLEAVQVSKKYNPDHRFRVGNWHIKMYSDGRTDGSIEGLKSLAYRNLKTYPSVKGLGKVTQNILKKALMDYDSGDFVPQM